MYAYEYEFSSYLVPYVLQTHVEIKRYNNVTALLLLGFRIIYA